MDYFAHGLWSYIFFHRSKKPIYAVLFGLLPDSLSWLIFLVYNLFVNGFQFGPPVVGNIPGWVFTLYGLTHSLVVCFLILAVVYLIFRTLPIYVFAWPIAIVMDALTHSREFLPTPVVWPFEWTFPGFSWGNIWFMLINYTLIISCFVYIYIKKNEKK